MMEVETIYSLIFYGSVLYGTTRAALTIMQKERENEALKRARNRRSILAAVKENGRALIYASDKLQGDIEIVLAAVKQNAEALEYAGKNLKADKEFVLEVSKIYFAKIKHILTISKIGKNIINYVNNRFNDIQKVHIVDSDLINKNAGIKQILPIICSYLQNTQNKVQEQADSTVFPNL